MLQVLILLLKEGSFNPGQMHNATSDRLPDEVRGLELRRTEAKGGCVAYRGSLLPSPFCLEGVNQLLGPIRISGSPPNYLEGRFFASSAEKRRYFSMRSL